MRNSQAGTSVLAALVFVAIFVLFISGYKVASQNVAGQSAAAAAATSRAMLSCNGGELYTVNMEYGSGTTDGLTCFKPDPKDPAAQIPGPDFARSECSQSVPGKCAIRYCPPSSYVSESGMCFMIGACDPSTDAACLKSILQNASQPAQAAAIIAAQLLADKGTTYARASGSSGPISLAEYLSENARSEVAAVIEATAQAAQEYNFDDSVIRNISKKIETHSSVRSESGAVAQISCQPKIAESGMKVGIAFGCANSSESEGGGFSTGGRLWGATEESIPSELPNGTMVYALRCSDGVSTASASCSVAVMKPFMLLSSQVENNTASFAWVTRGMDVCDISAPDDPELNSQFDNPVPQSGALTVSSLTEDTRVALTCTSVGGTIKEVTTTVTVAH